MVRLYPRRWRERYGAEFAELLAVTRLTPVVVLDVVRAAARERWRSGSGGLRALVAVLLFALCEVQAARLGVTENVLWAPTTPLRGAALAVTVAPLAALAAWLLRRRVGHRGEG
ncbi:hypothetical protein DQ238_12060 [Geodermatophilus sp. TF02-6]|nr:hypothetical protein DQ238_12060 [Geodermatophilus sp. TF02-6]